VAARAPRSRRRAPRRPPGPRPILLDARRGGAAAGGQPLKSDFLASVRALKSFPAELRARHDKVEKLERKLARWQRMRTPELSLEQRPPNPLWPVWFAAARERIAEALGARARRIEHFGSTSVPGLSSKNILDVAIGLDVPSGAGVEEALARLGYESYGNSPVDPQTVWLWKLEADRAIVLHICAPRTGRGSPSRWTCGSTSAPIPPSGIATRKRNGASPRTRAWGSWSTPCKLAITVDMVDRAQGWRAAAAESRS